ncbi:MAG: efflux RND transporter periplasmic adaptor subunit [Acetobacter sp.]|nr:efflux RND transporter periplasmic adaptor subunit [Acetobacter sp.]MCH4086817.1 efflux RND transporter periplasmic adaptor subunit [Acetobacter sp.]
MRAPVTRDVPDYLYATGQLAATASVGLVARVQGFLQAISYSDGAFVHKGDLLFTIEPAPYAAQRDQAKANLASAEATASFDELQSHRYAALARLDSASRQQAEQTRSSRDAANASVQQARAALTQTEITYGYTHVLAPFDGFVTAHQVHVGELVGGTQPTELAQIVRLDPIWVQFNISEDDAARLLRIIKDGGSPNGADVMVAVEVNGETGYPHIGHLDYVAPQIDPSTGTLSVRAVFDNPAHDLRPGNFAHIRVAIGVHRRALLVPTEAIGNDQSGRTLLVVGTNDRKIQARTVATGAEDGDLTVIETGLVNGDRVIVDNLQALRVGQTVAPQDVPPGHGGDTP